MSTDTIGATPYTDVGTGPSEGDILALPQADSIEVGVSEEQMVAAADYVMKCNSCDFTKNKSDPGGCPQGHVLGFGYVGPIPEEDHELVQSVAAAEHEGMIGVPLPIPGELAGVPVVASASAEDPEITTAMKIALGEIYGVQDWLEEAKADYAEKKESATNAKGRVEALQEDLSAALKRLRSLKTKSEPDPVRYPLLDKKEPPKQDASAIAKAEVNAHFAKPDSVAPLPADTFAEHLRRKQMATPLLEMGGFGVKPATIAALAELNLDTAFSITAKFTELFEKGREPTTLKGLTGARFGQIVEALGKLKDQAQAEWDVAHPHSPDGTDELAGMDGEGLE